MVIKFNKCAGVCSPLINPFRRFPCKPDILRCVIPQGITWTFCRRRNLHISEGDLWITLQQIILLEVNMKWSSLSFMMTEEADFFSPCCDEVLSGNLRPERHTYRLLPLGAASDLNENVNSSTNHQLWHFHFSHKLLNLTFLLLKFNK